MGAGKLLADLPKAHDRLTPKPLWFLLGIGFKFSRGGPNKPTLLTLIFSFLPCSVTFLLLSV
tara:strand:- start:5377 stop:5562 length:186 start_codon:yes stop_codon:yes gene_type:complete